MPFWSNGHDTRLRPVGWEFDSLGGRCAKALFQVGQGGQLGSGPSVWVVRFHHLEREWKVGFKPRRPGRRENGSVAAARHSKTPCSSEAEQATFNRRDEISKLSGGTGHIISLVVRGTLITCLEVGSIPAMCTAL
jgi:hypothetical protein